jgi:hypothetical protein
MPDREQGAISLKDRNRSIDLSDRSHAFNTRNPRRKHVAVRRYGVILSASGAKTTVWHRFAYRRQHRFTWLVFYLPFPAVMLILCEPSIFDNQAKQFQLV